MYTASGDDGFSVCIIKSALPVFIPIITNLVNKSIVSKCVPPKWKHACVTPIFKSGDKGDTNNYRPISVLPTISKIMERVVKNQLQSHLECHNIITRSQFGFRRNHSTETCILTMLNYLYEQIDNGCMGSVIYIDLKKAFDTVSHKIMLRKLSSIGLSAESVDWFASYLTDRSQVTRVSGKSSTNQPINIGVPQGSILGPVLFQIYVNDLPLYISNCHVSMFADDTAIYTASDSLIDLELMMQDELHSLSHWLLCNHLTINAKKSKVMLLGTNQRLRQARPLNVMINGTKLEQVEEYLYLGVILDSGLKMVPHCESIYDKCVKKLGLIYKTRHLFDYETARLIYLTMVLPILDYCSSVYTVAPEYELQKLQRLQNAALRLISRQDIMCPVYQLHQFVKVDTLATRAEKSLVKLCFKWVHGDGPEMLCKMMELVPEPVRQTRQSTRQDPVIPRVKSSMGQKAIRFRASTCWTNVKQELKTCTKLDQLKRKLRTVWDTFD